MKLLGDFVPGALITADQDCQILVRENRLTECYSHTTEIAQTEQP